MAFASLTAKLNLNIADFSTKLTKASTQMSNFAKGLTDTYGKANTALKSHNLGLKDTARIVQGILVSQAFYRIANAIQDATSSLLQFNEALDYAQVTYSALFGDAQLAGNFMKVLQEHSIETIFDYQQLTDASKKLLAYGVEYKNLMFVMEGLTNLGAMSGDAAALDRISLALGQIYTRGKLTAEEMRQLANAYVPIADIIQEKFNLTPEQMGKVGDLALPAGDVINSIVDYANERFGDVGDAAMYTLTGLKNKIRDTLKTMGAEIMTPFTTAYKSFLAYVARGLADIRKAYKTGGAGGIFEYLVPDANKQQIIRQFLANVRNMFMALMSVGVVVKQVLSGVLDVFVAGFNAVAPIVISVTNALAAALHGMLQTRTGATLLRLALLGAASAFVVMRVHAMGALVITAVTKAVTVLSKALLVLSAIITKHPILMLLAGLAVALVGVSLASNNANSGLNKLFDTLSGAGGGASSADVLQKVEQGIQDSSDAANEFNNRFEESIGAADDLKDSVNGVGKAAKKTAGLLSFDEVFKLNDTTDKSGGAASGVSDAISDLIDGLGSLGGALIPEIPDFSDYVDDFVDNLFGGLEEGIMDRLKDSGIGALLGAGIGGIIGSLLGNPVLGAKIGAFAGALIGWLWNDIQEAIGLSDTQGVTAGLAGLLGAAIGGMVGGPAGAAIGAGTGILASGLTSMLWNKLAEVFGKSADSAEAATFGSTVGMAIGALIGGIVGGPVGAIIGGAIGTLAGGLAGMFWDELKKTFVSYDTSDVSMALGAGIGGMLGFVTFGVPGALLGAGIGALAKNVIDGLWLKLGEMANADEGDISRASTASMIGTGIGTVLGMILGGPPGAAIGAAIGALGGGIVGMFWDKIKEGFAKPDTAIGAAIGASIGAFFGPVGAAIGAVVGGVIGNFWQDIKTGFEEWWTGISEGFAAWWMQLGTDWDTWCFETGEALATWWTGVKDAWQLKWDEISLGFGTWLETTKTTWSTKYDEIKTSLGEWWAGIASDFLTKQEGVLNSLSAWLTTTKTTWSTKYDEIKAGIGEWWTGVKSDYSIMQTDVLTSLSKWLEDTKNNWSTKYGEIKTNLGTWWSGVKTDLGTNFGSMLNTTKEKLLGIKNEWSLKWDEIKTNYGTWWSGIKTSMGTWLEDCVWKPIDNFFNLENFWNRIKGLLDAIKSKVSDWWSSVTSIFSSSGSSSGSSGGGGGGGGINIRPSSKTGSVPQYATIDDDPGVPGTTAWKKMYGHAAGGIFNREHIARFAEGNKAEAVIPLENASAMQPFVSAISDGILQGLLPVMASNGSSSNLPPMYVGTLIADDRGLKQLYKKFELIEAQEAARKGFA